MLLYINRKDLIPMATIFNFQEIQLNKIKCGPIQKISNNFMIIPITYFKKPLIIQTPLLTLPSGIQFNQEYNKTYAKMKFPRLQNSKQYAFLKFIKDTDSYLLKNKYPKIWKKLRRKITNKEYRPSLSKSGNFFNTQMLDTSTIFNENGIQIDSTQVLHDSSAKGICMLSCLWIHKNVMGPLWSTPQLKIYDSPINNCMITDDPVKITPKTTEIECPCCSFKIDVKVKVPTSLAPKINKQVIASEIENSHIFEKYVKMRGLGVPIQAVHQKIQMEGQTVADFEKYLREKSLNVTNTHSQNIIRPAPMRPTNNFSMSDLLSQRKNLKKAKPRKKIKEDNKFNISQRMRSANTNVIVPTLQDIVNSMKSLKSTGIRLDR